MKELNSFRFTEEPIPLYYQIKRKLIEVIDNKFYLPGDLIMSEREMCAVFKVSRPTVRQAINELVVEGVLKKIKGKGTFVAEPKFTYGSVQDIATFYENLIGRGYSSETEVLYTRVELPTVKVREKLDLGPDIEIIEIKRVRYIEKDPVVIIINHIPYNLCPGLEKMHLTDKSLYNLIHKEFGLPLLKSHVTLYPSLADEIDAKLLLDKKGSPIQVVENLSYTKNGLAMDFFESKFKGNYGKIYFETAKPRIAE